MMTVILFLHLQNYQIIQHCAILVTYQIYLQEDIVEEYVYVFYQQVNKR